MLPAVRTVRRGGVRRLRPPEVRVPLTGRRRGYAPDRPPPRIRKRSVPGPKPAGTCNRGHCRRPAKPGRKWCCRCLELQAAYTNTYRRRNGDEGKCSRCPNPRTDGQMCDRCRETTSTRERARYAARRAAGICVHCENRTDMHACFDCRVHDSARRRGEAPPEFRDPAEMAAAPDPTREQILPVEVEIEGMSR